MAFPAKKQMMPMDMPSKGKGGMMGGPEAGPMMTEPEFKAKKSFPKKKVGNKLIAGALMGKKFGKR